MDLTKLSDQDLDALSRNDLSSVSDEGLNILSQSVASDSVSINAPLDSTAIADRSNTPKFTSSLTGRQVTEGTSETINPYAREQTLKGMAQTARMAPVIAAGALTGGMGVIPTMAAMSATSAAGELGAQGIEMASGQRNDFNGRSIAASGVAGLAPVVGPSAGVLKALAANVGGTLAASEAAHYVSTPDDYSAPKGLGEFVSRVAMPTVLPATATGLAKVGFNLSKVNESKKAIEAAREGGNVMLSELIGSWTKGEAKQLAKGNPKALAAYNGALSKISANVVDDLSKYADGDTAKSIIDAIVTNNIIKPAQIEKLLSDAGIAEAKFGSLADKAALSTKLAEYSKEAIKGKILAGGIPELSRISQTGVAGGIAQDAHFAADSAAAAKISEMYDQSGIGMDDAVVTRPSVLNNIENSKSLALDDKAALSGSVIGLFGDKETLSLSEYRKARDIIAAKLIHGGADVSSAKRVATQGFAALKDASDEFMQKTRAPVELLTFNKANSMAKARFDASTSKAIDLVEAGSVEKLYDSIIEQGPSNKLATGSYNPSVSNYDGLMKYADMLEQNLGLDASNEYKRNVHSMIRDGAFRKSLNKANGYVSAEKLYDPQKLVTEFANLDRAGINIGQLGVGTISDVRDMAKAFTIAGADKVSTKDISEFLKITSMGGDYGKFKTAFNDLRRTFMEANGSPTTEQINKVLGRHKDAKLPQTALQEALNAANNDPLTQLLKAPSEAGSVGNYGLNKNDLTQNVKFTESLVGMNTTDVKKFADAMRNSGRADDLETLAKTAASNALFLFEDFSQSTKPAIKAKDIANTFFGEEAQGIKLRNNLKALMGDEAYGNMMDKFVKPSADFVKHTQKFVEVSKGNEEVLKGLASIRGLVSGNTTGGTLFANAVNNSMNLTKVIGYNTMYNLTLGKYADSFAKSGYNLSKFASASPVNSTIIKLGMREKELADQEKQAQESPQ